MQQTLSAGSLQGAVVAPAALAFRTYAAPTAIVYVVGPAAVGVIGCCCVAVAVAAVGSVFRFFGGLSTRFFFLLRFIRTVASFIDHRTVARQPASALMYGTQQVYIISPAPYHMMLQQYSVRLSPQFSGLKKQRLDALLYSSSS